MKVLVTGGAGYIGSTTAKALEVAGHTPVILDSLLTGPRAFVKDRAFYEGDIADRALLRRIVDEHPDLDCTIHMAARIVVPESVAQPVRVLPRQRRQVAGAVRRARGARQAAGGLLLLRVAVRTVEGFEVDEQSRSTPTSPYARTKRMMEKVLEDMAEATELRTLILRYFNPIGADPDLESGRLRREPSHVLGQLVLAATGSEDAFTITGTDLPTRDGTGIRDYLHVWDLAQAHVAAVERFDAVLGRVGAPTTVINIGTGEGVTVRELLSTFEQVFGRPVPTVEAPPRPGDVVGAYANVDKARDLLSGRSS